MRLGVGKLESASFQSPEETSPIQKDRVESEPSLVDRWRFGTGGLLLNLGTCQSCDESSNADHLLDALESERAAEELGRPLLRKYWATTIGRPPEPERAPSPALPEESDKTDPLVERRAECLTTMTLAKRSADPPCPRHKRAPKRPSHRSDNNEPSTQPEPQGSKPWP